MVHVPNKLHLITTSAQSRFLLKQEKGVVMSAHVLQKKTSFNTLGDVQHAYYKIQYLSFPFRILLHKQ